jgi:hypothetical protein
MKDTIVLAEKINLIEEEIKSLASKLEEMRQPLAEIADIKREAKALKLFLARQYPDFKYQFPEILEKIKS